jgi:hypothetical protein
MSSGPVTKNQLGNVRNTIEAVPRSSDRKNPIHPSLEHPEQSEDFIKHLKKLLPSNNSKKGGDHHKSRDSKNHFAKFHKISSSES